MINRGSRMKYNAKYAKIINANEILIYSQLMRDISVKIITSKLCYHKRYTDFILFLNVRQPLRYTFQ